VRQHVERTGHGPPLLALHGFTGSAASWSELGERLADSFELIAPDLVGHGRSPAAVDVSRYSMESACADLLAILDELGIDRANVLGYSMGGRLALYFAVHHAERVDRLIVESASPGIDDPVQRAARAEADDALADRIERDGVGAFIAAWETQPLLAPAPHVPDGVIAAQRGIRRQHSVTGLANSLRGMGTGRQPSLWASLARLEASTLLITGERDERYREIATRMVALLPNAEHARVAEAGHTVHVDQPAAFASLVERFLEGPSKPRRPPITRRT